MRLFDLHCDSATALFDKGENLSTSTCHISKDSISSFSSYSQIFAIFSKPNTSDDDCYKRFFDVTDRFTSENYIEFCENADALSERKHNFILSVEDARLLGCDISRLDALYSRGVRVLTPLWSGVTCIGGSFDTNGGLTHFGKQVVIRCCELGIIPDISHASERSAKEIVEISAQYGSPVIASHSDSYSVNPHPRNLNDALADDIKSLGGLVGICLHAPHLGEGNVTAETVVRHIDYFCSLIGHEVLALGCDFDGTDSLPCGIRSQSDLYMIADELLRRGYREDLIDSIFYKNAYNFFKRNITH